MKSAPNLPELRQLRRVTPDSRFVSSLQARLEALVPQPAGVPSVLPALWLRVAFAVLLFFILSSAGMVVVARSSQPGDFLYPVKKVTVKVQETFVPPTPTPAPTPETLPSSRPTPHATPEDSVTPSPSTKPDDHPSSNRQEVKGAADKLEDKEVGNPNPGDPVMKGRDPLFSPPGQDKRSNKEEVEKNNRLPFIKFNWGSLKNAK